MLQAIKLMVGASHAHKRTKRMEGASTIERTTMRMKDQTRKVPEPIVVLAKINGHQIRALLDTGSMADFLSTTVVDQLELQKEYYSKPLSVQLAVHGSRSKINCGARVNFQYQNINCERRFDIANLDNYDAILGTPFLFQHKVAVGINPSCVVVGSDKPVELDGPEVVTINSAAADLLDDGLDKLRAELRKEAEDLCTDTSKTQRQGDCNISFCLIKGGSEGRLWPLFCWTEGSRNYIPHIRLRSLLFDRRCNYTLVFVSSPAVFDAWVGEDLASVESHLAYRT